MYQIFFEALRDRLYPSTLLHAFGVNGKIAGSVGAIGEMGGRIVAVVHGPMGCAFHYRYSVRRRHQPFWALLCSDLTEQEIVFGGEEKLRETVLQAWQRYRPDWIFVVPTPVSDVLSEDIRRVSTALQGQGVPVVAIQSELFSHRDKNFYRDRLHRLSQNRVSGDNRLEMDLNGCGFTEALYALVEQVMQPQERIPHSINIETVNWGCEGRLVLREMEAFLAQCGVRVNCWIPSSDMETLKKAPTAELNLVKRVRWARRMQEKFGTDYLHLGSGGRYVGLDGIATLYRDIAEKLHLTQTMEPLIAQAVADVHAQTAASRQTLSQFSCAVACRGLQSAPFRVKLYAREFGVPVRAVCVFLPPDLRKKMGYTDELEAKMLGRIQEAIDLYAPGAEIVYNPEQARLRQVFGQVDAVLGTDDMTLEGFGAPLIPVSSETISLSFPSYIRNLERLARRLENREERNDLLLNRMPLDARSYTRFGDTATMASNDIWRRMWLERKENGR